MAIQLVGTQTGTGTITNTASVTFSLTAGETGSTTLQQGDFVLVQVSETHSAQRAPTVTGYTQVGTTQYGNDTCDVTQYVGYKFMGSTPDTGLTITDDLIAAGYGRSWTIHVYRGVDQTTPLDVAAVQASSINGAAPNPSAITPISAGARVVVMGGGGIGSASSAFTYNTPSDLSNFQTVAASGSSWSAVAGAGDFAWSSGAFDPVAWVLATRGNNAADAAASTVVALRPAASLTGTHTSTTTVGSSEAGTVAAPGTAVYVNFPGDNNITNFGLSDGAGTWDYELAFRLTGAQANVSFQYFGGWNVYVDGGGNLYVYNDLFNAGANTSAGVSLGATGTEHTLRSWGSTTANGAGRTAELYYDNTLVWSTTTAVASINFSNARVMGIGAADWCPSVDVRRVHVQYNGGTIMLHADENAATWNADARVLANPTDVASSNRTGSAAHTVAITTSQTGTVVSNNRTGTAAHSIAVGSSQAGTVVSNNRTGTASHTVAITSSAAGTQGSNNRTGDHTATLTLGSSLSGTVVSNNRTGTHSSTIALASALAGTNTLPAITGSHSAALTLTSSAAGTNASPLFITGSHSARIPVVTSSSFGRTLPAGLRPLTGLPRDEKFDLPRGTMRGRFTRS